MWKDYRRPPCCSAGVQKADHPPPGRGYNTGRRSRFGFHLDGAEGWNEAKDKADLEVSMRAIHEDWSHLLRGV